MIIRGAENASTQNASTNLQGWKMQDQKNEYVPVNIFVKSTVELLSLCQTRLKQLNKICIL